MEEAKVEEQPKVEEQAKAEEQAKIEEKMEHAKEKKTISISMPNIRGKDRFETVENFSILFIAIGSITLAVGMVIAGLNTVGLGPIMAMMGTLIAFLATVVLIYNWLAKDFFSD